MNWWNKIKARVDSWLGHLAEENEKGFDATTPSCCGTEVPSCCGTDTNKGGGS